MHGEMILIGDELITGRIGDANLQVTASHLWALGLRIEHVQMIGDDPGDITKSFELARRADFIIVSGGLGTTEDDITNEVAADFFKLPVKEHPVMLANLKELATAKKWIFKDSHRRQAMMPEGVDLLDKFSAG